MAENQLIYDWNQVDKEKDFFLPTIEVCDETLRDGLQSPSVYDPPIREKLKLIELMEQLGITIADIGLPGAGPRAFADVLRIAQFVKDQRYKLKVNRAARTVVADIAPIAKIQHQVGIPITAYCFLGASPIRQMVEDWSLDKLKKTCEKAINFAIAEGLDVAFVTEDTTRSHPDTLKTLFQHAIELGANRLVLCDTVGHATPHGVKTLVNFTKQLIKKSNAQVKIDWHGHNDRGLAVCNAIFAAKYGCHRIHGTALGIGERVGNTSLDQLLVNLRLLNRYPHNLKALTEYVEKAAKFCRVPLIANYPVFGADAFRTATGVHAAAVIKAKKKHDQVLSDTIYSGVPAHWFGKKQNIEVGPMSGASNVRYWLLEKQFPPTEEMVQKILARAKKSSRVLYDEELKDIALNS